MVILGIDPGTQRMGYGVVASRGGVIALLDGGILRIKSKTPAGALRDIKRSLDALIKRHRPQRMAIERLYFSRNQKTALRVAEARGVALLAAAEHNLELWEYGPNELKANLTGYGAADKRAVLKIVRYLLGEPDLAVPDDASDALALAILAARERRRSYPL